MAKKDERMGRYTVRLSLDEQDTMNENIRFVHGIVHLLEIAMTHPDGFFPRREGAISTVVDVALGKINEIDEAFGKLTAA